MTNVGLNPKAMGLAAIVAALALQPGPAAADGIPGVVMTDSQFLTDWSGLYIGGKLGGAFSNFNWQTDANPFNTGGAVGPNTPIEFSPDSVIGGIMGGANLQLGQWIFGGEATFSGTGLSQSVKSPFFPATDTFSTDLNWLGTIEGRLGYSWDHVMVFAKGGWALSNATLKVTSPVRGSASKSEFVDGWTIGGGVEYAVWNSVIIGLEYDYTRISLTSNGSCALCDAGLVIDTTPSEVTGDVAMSAVMLRASYLFMPED